MSKQRHIIGRTVLELDTKQLADVWSLQEDVSRLFQQQGLEEIARLFDQLVTDEEVVRLDQLVVEIGSIDRRFLADEFIYKLVAALRETLSDRLTDRLLHQSANDKIICDAFGKPQGGYRTGSDWEVFLYFLRYGRLPWWCPNHSWQSWLPRWEAVVQSETNWQQDLRKLLVNYPATQQRLVEQLPESFRHQLILQLQPAWTTWHTLLSQAKQLMQSLELGRDVGQYLERQAWLLLLGEIGADNLTKPFPTTWIRRWLAQLVQMVDREQGSRGVEEAGGAGRAGEEILWQRLRNNIDAVSSGERNLWLSAYDQVLNMTDLATTSPASENSPVRPQTDWEIFLYFLQYGRLPWGQKSEDWQDWLPRWETVIQNETAWQMPLRELLRNNVATRQRLVTQLPEALRYQLILQLQPAWTNWYTLLAQAKQLMQSLSLRRDTPTESFHERFQQLETLAWELLLAEIRADNTSISPLPAATWIPNWLAQLVQNWRLTAGEEILWQKLRTNIDAVSPGERSLWLSAYNQVLNMTDLATTSPAPQNTEDRPQTDWQVLLYFLESGLLPSKEASADLQDWFPRWETVIQTETAWQMPIRELLRNNVATRQRLVTQLPESLRHQIVLQLQPTWTNWHTLLAQAKQLMQSLNLRSDRLVDQAWLLLFAEIGTDNTALRTLPTEIWTQKWLVELVQIWLETPEFNRLSETSVPVEQVELTQEKRFDSPETTRQVLSQSVRNIIGTFPIVEHFPWLSALDQILTTTSSIISLSGNLQETPIFQSDRNSILSSDEEAAGLYITHAGLVLLHPFLRSYLEAVGLLEGESFRDELAQQTGIYLLHYLATKQIDAPEYELVLPKLLCGWSLNQPVVRGLDLPLAALEEGEKLLQTVITYWQTLKSTSPDGLREGFLQREGKLTRNGDGNWKLQVEQQAIDILLGSLPWGLSMVTLPWMEGLLIVEWH